VISQAARGGDDLYTVSLMTFDDLPASERKRLIRARDSAVNALHQYADWLDAGLSCRASTPKPFTSHPLNDVWCPDGYGCRTPTANDQQSDLTAELATAHLSRWPSGFAQLERL